MTLDGTEFAPLLTAITDNLPFIIGFVVSVAALMWVLKIVRRTVKA